MNRTRTISSRSNTRTGGRRIGAAVAGLVVCAVAATTVLAQQSAPRFQASVDVTSVDVAVVDDAGRPMTNLLPGDFTVRIDGESRRVVSAQWVPLLSEGAAPPAPSLPGYTSNQVGASGRLIVLAVDQPGIRFGGTAAVTKAASAFIDKLSPSDRVAVVGFGKGGMATPFLTDFERAKQAIAKTSGQRPSEGPQNYSVSVSEAVAINHNSGGTLDRVIGRECAQIRRNTPAFNQCASDVESQARQIAGDTEQQTRSTLEGLNALFTGLRSIEAPKTVVLVTEGFIVDDSELVATELGSLAAASRATLYVLHLDDQLFESVGARRAQASFDDRRARVNQLQAMADRARGDVFSVTSSSAAAFARIGSETSGYYLLGLESNARDRDGKAHPIRVDVSRSGAIVRSRRQVLEAAPEIRSPQQAVTAGLSSPLPLTTLPLRVGTFALQGPEPGKVQMLIHADVGSDYSAPRAVAIGYAIFDERGTMVEARRIENRLQPVMAGVPSALQFTAGASLPPGNYTLKLAAAEGDRAGSVDHPFQARLASAGAVTLSELMVGGPAAVAAREPTSPTIGYTVSYGSLHGYVEAYGPQAETVTVKYEIAAGETSSPLVATDVPGQLAGDDRMIFTLVMPVSQLPPGRYVLRALVSAAAKPLKTLVRAFEIAPPAVLMASADGRPADVATPDVFLPVSDQAFLRPFAKDEPLNADVLKAFRDRVSPALRASFDAGVTALMAGDYARAEASFKAAVQPDTDSTSAIAYVAVTFAARNHDLEAAGAWQTALIDGSDVPQVYDWLAQALLRTHNLPEARAILEEANRKWPADPRFQGPLASVYATFGKGREAVRLLELYLENRPADLEAAKIGVEWMYQLRTTGAVVHTRADDAKLAHQWAARYGNGPQEALVRQWLEAIDK